MVVVVQGRILRREAHIPAPGSRAASKRLLNAGDCQDNRLNRLISKIAVRDKTMHISSSKGKTSYERRLQARITRYAVEDRLR
ncbi:MAG: hypothetical protein PWR25_309 [Euryarchaeota archaeon]|jgi:stalled ribosome alternative rescue factor ArfA|nr:hypothetical protein [Euryarchaeota archaeon]